MGGDLITYAHSQLRVMLNLAALAQMTQNNTEQNIKENRAQNNTAKEITRVPKYNWSNRQRASNWEGRGREGVMIIYELRLPRRRLVSSSG